MDQSWILGAQPPEFLRICRDTENDRRCRIEGLQYAGNLAIAHWPHNDKVMIRCILFTPRIAIEDGNIERLTFGLPAGRQQPGEFAFIGKDDYVGVWQ